MAIVPIDDFPGPPPTRLRPETFSEDLDLFLSHLQTFVDQVNAIAEAINSDVDLIAYRDAAAASAAAAAASAAQAAAIVGGQFVSYGTAQGLSDGQQAQARANIGAASQGDALIFAILMAATA